VLCSQELAVKQQFFIGCCRRQLFRRLLATETDSRVGGSIERGQKWLCKWFDDVEYSVRCLVVLCTASAYCLSLSLSAYVAARRTEPTTGECARFHYVCAFQQGQGRQRRGERGGQDQCARINWILAQNLENMLTCVMFHSGRRTSRLVGANTRTVVYVF